MLERIEVAHVRLEVGRALAQLRGVGLEQIRLESHQRDVRALCVQALGRRLADPACGSGDEHGAPVDVERSRARTAHEASAGAGAAARASEERGRSS